MVSKLPTWIFACSIAPMFSRWKITCGPLAFCSSLCFVAYLANAQEVTAEPSSAPETNAAEEVEEVEKPDTPVVPPTPAVPVIWRGTMTNLLVDSMARLPFGESDTLRAPIAVHFPEQKSAICWDTKACRLVYAWKGEFLAQNTTTQIATPAGEITYLASGAGQFSAAVGAYGKPKYFGFKLVNGSPEFYYSIGRVAIRERFSFSENGESLLQHFAIDNSPGEVVITVPGLWKDRVSSEKGSLKNRILTVSKSDAADFTLNYSLIPDEAPTE